MGRLLPRTPLIWTLAAAAVGIRFFSADPQRVERFYSDGLYPGLSRLMRAATGLLPFSAGDLLYGALILFILWRVVRSLRLIGARGWKALLSDGRAGRFLTFLLAVYVIFNLAWGLNYDRLGISHQLGLAFEESDTAGLQALAEDLLQQTNLHASVAERLRVTGTEELKRRSVAAYAKAGGRLRFLAYGPVSVKTSLFGSIGNHLGYTGYYNPFTAEAQLNDAIPPVLKPFVLVHEVAHQLGYAHESEANFVGFLAARASEDSLLLYSAHLDMFLYANAALFWSDSLQARRNLELLDTAARRDIAELRAFRIRYQGPLEKAVDMLYDRYLKMNRQPDGRASYSMVVRWLLAYRRKEGGL